MKIEPESDDEAKQMVTAAMTRLAAFEAVDVIGKAGVVESLDAADIVKHFDVPALLNEIGESVCRTHFHIVDNDD